MACLLSRVTEFPLKAASAKLKNKGTKRLKGQGVLGLSCEGGGSGTSACDPQASVEKWTSQCGLHPQAPIKVQKKSKTSKTDAKVEKSKAGKKAEGPQQRKPQGEVLTHPTLGRLWRTTGARKSYLLFESMGIKRLLLNYEGPNHKD